MMVPVKIADVDNGRVLGSTLHKTEKDHFVLNQITFGKDMSKKGGMDTDRIKVLLLEFLKSIIENVYTSKKVRYLEYNRHTLLLVVVFQVSHKFLPT